MNKIKRTFPHMKMLIAFLLISTGLFAQPVVSVSVVPPNSSVAKDYLQQGNNVLITLTNNSSLSQSVKIIPSIKGVSNNVRIAVKESFTPAVLLVLNPGQTRVITLNQLKINNSNLSPDDIITQGMDKNQYLNGGLLPEGMYTVCIKAIINDPSGGIRSSQGCATVNIISFQPPIIVNPVDNASVKPLQPQFITFSWTPSGLVGQTRYRFRLVDLTETKIFNPNDAFANGNILPFFEQQNILTTSLQMDNTKPKLKAGNRYALQVTAYHPQNKLNFKNAGRSQVIVFTYKNELPFANPAPPKKDMPIGDNKPPKKNEEEVPSGDCAASSKFNGALKQANKNGIANGTDVLVGKFVMKNTSFTQTNGSYTGTGEILVNFVGAKMKVKFSGIQIGDDNRMFKGAITGIYDASAGITDAMAASKTEIIKSLPNAAALMSKLENAARKVNTADLPVPMDLPLSFDKNDFNIGIVGMIFEPTEAYINAVLNTQIPQVFGNQFMLLSAKGVAIHPNGYGSNASLKLSLAETQTLDIVKDKMQLQLIGGADKTFASFDCTGFKNISIAGAVVLPRSVALPYDASNKLIEDENIKVKVPFSISAATSLESLVFSGLAFSHAFAVPQARDFIFKAQDAAFDLSSSQKINDISAADNAIGNDWIGLYMKSLSLTLPEGFKKNGGRVTVGVENMFVNKMGIKGSFNVQGAPLVTGAIAGWTMTLTKVFLNIDKNALTGGGMDGTVSLPIGDKATVGFKGIVSKGDETGAKVALTVITKDELDANLFLAKIKLEPNSQITLSKEGNTYSAAALLNGEIGIDFAKNTGGGNVGKFSLPSIAFQELSIKGKENAAVPDFDMKFIALQNPGGIQAKIANFELNLNDLQFKKPDATHAGLSLSLGLSLFGGEGDTKSGAGANTTFTIWAKHTGKTFVYEKASLDAIAINADLGVAKLAGAINLYKEDPKFGNGFRGAVSATLNGLGVKVDVGLQFGRTLKNAGDYKYWYFDAMADFGKVGINIPGTAASIYGFGGGAYCNMTRNAPQQPITPGNYKQVKNETAAPTTSGVIMEPKKGSAGFRAAVLFGITGSREAFNGDVTFSMELDAVTQSVTLVELDGNAYLMQDPTNIAKRSPNKAFLYCHANIKYDKKVNTLSGNFAATLNIVNIVEGGGDISFKFTTPKKDINGDIIPGQSGLKWYIKVGQWTPNKDPFDDSARLHAEVGFDAKVLKVEIKLQGYFMVGNDLPSGLPPLPDKIYAVTASLGAPLKTGLPAAVSSAQGLAFAFGAGIKVGAQYNGIIFDAVGEAAAGFDVLLSDLNATCEGKPMGFEGWYAQGQAYAYIDVSIKALSKEIIGLSAGAVLQIKLPNPTWVRGDVFFKLNIGKINADFTYVIEKGKVCESMKADMNPFEFTKLIKNITAGPNEKTVNPLNPDLKATFTYADNGTPIKVFNAYTEDYNVYYAQNELFLTDNNKKIIDKVSITGMGNSPHKTFKIIPKFTLNPKTDYYVYAKSSIYNELKEELYYKFTTGEAPSKFSMNDLYDSYPLPGQRYFMKQKAGGEKVYGYLALKQDLAYLFNSGQGVYVLIMDAKDQLVNAQQVKAYTKNSNGASSSSIPFEIPATLKNSTVYQIKVLAPDDNSAMGEVIFDGFYFRTSKYNNTEEKMKTFKVVKTGYVKNTLNTVSGNKYMSNEFVTPVLMLKGGEGLDGYEMNGFYQTVNGDNDLYGKLLEVSDGDNNYLFNTMKKYRDFQNYLSNKIPELTESEYTYMKNIRDNSDLSWERPAGYPFNGESSSPFSKYKDLTWIQNIKSYELSLHGYNYLKADEKLTGPDKPLSADEINNAGSGSMMNQGLGLSNAPAKTEYYALVNNIPYIAAWDHMNIANAYLKEANSRSGSDLTKTWNILNKMGLPKMTYGPQKVNILAKVKSGNGLPFKGELPYNLPYPKN